MKTSVDIKKFLPHRAPMLMADKLTHVAENSAEGTFFISPSCIFLTPQKILSETGLLEHAAQICSAVVGSSFFEKDDLEGKSNNIVGYISTIKKAQLYRLPSVNQQIHTQAKLINHVKTTSFSTCAIQSKTFYNADLLVDCTVNFLIHEV